MSDEVTVKFLSPGSKLIESKAFSVELMAIDGECEIFPMHANAFFRLGTGRLVLKQGSTNHKYTIHGGVAKFRDNELLVLSEKIVPEIKV
jgi:F0F1-type ATP synthase epsilon subunit